MLAVYSLRIPWVLQASPTPQEAMGASEEQIAELLTKADHPTAEKGAAKIFQALQQPHLEAFAITTRTKSRLTLVLIRQLLPLLEEIASSDKEIERLFLTHEAYLVFSSLPRAGKRLAPRRLPEIPTGCATSVLKRGVSEKRAGPAT